MAENKQYITHDQEFGTLLIADDVVGAIVVSSLKDVEGVIGIGGKLGFDLASIKNWAKALRINIAEGNTVTIDCNIIVAYGQSVIQVAKNAQDAITSAVESMTGVKPAAVNVNVIGIARK